MKSESCVTANLLTPLVLTTDLPALIHPKKCLFKLMPLAESSLAGYFSIRAAMNGSFAASRTMKNQIREIEATTAIWSKKSMRCIPCQLA